MSQVKYSLNDNGVFQIDQYNSAKTFSNFFPGIAGLWGTPMWVFFVNRGQAIASFGIESKDKAIMEFQPANKAYRQTALQGFRTFVKVRKGSKQLYWEPFQEHLKGTDYNKTQSMAISSHDLKLTEKNKTLGLEAEVHYFTLPDEPMAALYRKVVFKNTSRAKVELDMVDGMPMIIPYGMKDWLSKNMSRTVEAWVKVRNMKKKAAYYQLNVEVEDTSRVTHITEGNFFFSFPLSGSKNLADPIVEAKEVFGATVDFLAPEAFLQENFKVSSDQKTENKTPSAMAHYKRTVQPGATFSFVSVFGYASSEKQVNAFVKRSQTASFVNQKARLNQDIIDHIKGYALTHSSSSAFNLYSGATFLDNILRGGLPVTISTKDGDAAFNVYSRKHGDLERDYNFFTVAPTFYSQGNGNYRDVNQNRRNDVFFNTDVREGHLVNFLNLSQADGYNPLVVRGTSFSFKNKKDIPALLQNSIRSGQLPELETFLSRGFLPGDLLAFIQDHNYALKTNIRDFLGKVLALCEKRELATHGEGFWSDHWTYNLDLIESYLGVYPERLKYLFLECQDFTFYLNHHYVLPRSERYVETPYGVRQYNSVLDDSAHFNPEIYDNKLRTDHNKGGVYRTHLFCKLLCLIANKTATLDPSGVGIEMEADKPNWYDALNGLPGLLGSSISETMELKRYAQFCLEACQSLGLSENDMVSVFSELGQFIQKLSKLLRSEKDDYAYWVKANDIKEAYRKQVRRSIQGSAAALSIKELKVFLQAVVDKTTRSFEKAKDQKGFLTTYLFHEVVDYQGKGDKGSARKGPVTPTRFQRHNLPQFLEGYVHALKTADVDEAKALFKSVKQSGLYDKKLKMFKVNESLASQTEEIGRTRIFPSGWLENESVWLHMEYKFMLELLRSGLHQEFYACLPYVLVAFLNPEIYGRSILENSSFIASSAHEDESIHGQGFVARLSGSTAEFLHIWLIMNVGEHPFRVNDQGQLVLHFQPVLAEWLFTKASSRIQYLDCQFQRTTASLPRNTYAFRFLGKALVVYHNPKRRSTFGFQKASPVSMTLTYGQKKKPQSVSQPYLEGSLAEDVRRGDVTRLDVYLDTVSS